MAAETGTAWNCRQVAGITYQLSDSAIELPLKNTPPGKWRKALVVLGSQQVLSRAPGGTAEESVRPNRASETERASASSARITPCATASAAPAAAALRRHPPAWGV